MFSFFNPRLVPLSLKRERTWGGGGAPCSIECKISSRQRPADSLGRFGSNGVRVDLHAKTFIAVIWP